MCMYMISVLQSRRTEVLVYCTEDLWGRLSLPTKIFVGSAFFEFFASRFFSTDLLTGGRWHSELWRVWCGAGMIASYDTSGSPSPPAVS